MPDRAGADGAGVLPALLGLLLLPILVACIWVAVAFERRHGRCADLGNGLLLGYEALVDLGRPFGKPIAVPKDPGGTPLIRDETWEVQTTATTVHGVAMRPDPANDYRSVWRADAGLIPAADDRGAYERLVSEAGPSNWGIQGAVGTKWLMDELSRRPDFETQRCPTALFTW